MISILFALEVAGSNVSLTTWCLLLSSLSLSPSVARHGSITPGFEFHIQKKCTHESLSFTVSRTIIQTGCDNERTNSSQSEAVVDKVSGKLQPRCSGSL